MKIFTPTELRAIAFGHPSIEGRPMLEEDLVRLLLTAFYMEAHRTAMAGGHMARVIGYTATIEEAVCTELKNRGFTEERRADGFRYISWKI